MKLHVQQTIAPAQLLRASERRIKQKKEEAATVSPNILSNDSMRVQTHTKEINFARTIKHYRKEEDGKMIIINKSDLDSPLRYIYTFSVLANGPAERPDLRCCRKHERPHQGNRTIQRRRWNSMMENPLNDEHNKKRRIGRRRDDKNGTNERNMFCLVVACAVVIVVTCATANTMPSMDAAAREKRRGRKTE